MRPDAILHKTDKGREEITSRAHGLSARLRQLLITVDGSLSAGDIAHHRANLEETFALLEELRALGHIVVEGDGNASAAATQKAELDPERIALARHWLSEFVQGTLGGAGGDAVGRIMRCRTHAELDVLAESCGEVVAAVAGRHKAELFLAEWRRVFAPS